MNRIPGHGLARGIRPLALVLAALLGSVVLGGWLVGKTRPLERSVADNRACKRHRVIGEGDRRRLEVIRTTGSPGGTLLVTTTLVYDNDGYITETQVKDPPQRAIAALKALDQTLAAREWSKPVIDQAYQALGEGLTLTSCPQLDDQLIVLEALNLKLLQLAALHEEGDPELKSIRRFMRESFSSKVDGLKPSPHSGIYEGALLPLLDDPAKVIRACQTLKSLAEQQPGFLEGLALASHGQIRYAPEDLCVNP
jgi:hypothetical protein